MLFTSPRLRGEGAYRRFGATAFIHYFGCGTIRI